MMPAGWEGQLNRCTQDGGTPRPAIQEGAWEDSEAAGETCLGATIPPGESRYRGAG